MLADSPWLLDISLAGAALGFAALGAGLAAAAARRVAGRLSGVARRLLLSWLAIALILVGGELWFRNVHADSGWAFTLAHENWRKAHWEINSHGFRDREWRPEDWRGRRTLVVLGDSFAAGWGVDDPANRFPDVLARRLGDDWVVLNYALPGHSTAAQLRALVANPPERPDAVLLQYFLNDIEDAAASVSRHYEPTFPPFPPRLVRESYLVNFVYWGIYGLRHSIQHFGGDSYWDWQYATHDDSAIFALHRAELETLIGEVERLGADLYVVLFPNMEDAAASAPYLERVAQVFADRGYGDRVLALADEAADFPAQPVVSNRDAHPSAAFHVHLGGLIYERFFESP